PPMTPPEFRGLYGHVVTSDCYGLRTMDFEPDVILDIGANVGVFARFARSRFPSSKIVCVEPGARNFAFLKHLTGPDENMVFLNKAIGQGTIFGSLNAVNGAHEVYYGEDSPGSSRVFPGYGPQFVPCEIEGVMLDQLVAEYCSEDVRYMAKIDIEAADLAIFEHPASVDALRDADCFALELHRGQNFNAPPLNRFHDTHAITQKHVELIARKR
ncbi:MAG: FkbM family methyltransferase, partial [Planctomycetota bacterium]